MIYKGNSGTMDISHVFIVITLVALAIAILAPFHFNIKDLESMISLLASGWGTNYNNPSYITTSATVSKSYNLATITINIVNNGNNQLIIGGTTTIGSALCNLDPSIIIPPHSEGTLTLAIYTMNGTAEDPISINVGGSAYSTGIPQIFCYGSHIDLTLNNGFTIVFSTVNNNGNIYVTLNQ